MNLSGRPSEGRSKEGVVGVKRTVAIVVVLMVVLGMTGVASAGTVTVKAGASGNHFSPSAKSVPKGTKVVWKNVSVTKHTVTSYSKNWSKKTGLPAGSSTSFVFKTKGVYKYRCTLHSTLSGGVCSGMCGKITVG